MKRVGHLFEPVVALGNLERAARRARCGKRYRRDVLRFEHHAEDELLALQSELADGSWQPGDHRHFLIHEPKRRWISAAPYRDRVVHHALCAVIGPVLERRLIFDCWANRRRKGSHRAVLRYQARCSQFRFVLKVDVRKYFPSIDHQILKDQLRAVFKDERLLAIIDRIIDRGRVPEPHHAYFRGDDLFTPTSRRKGLPIGNLTSQLWANSYLGGLDHWVKQRLRAKGYVRFVDDFLLLADDSATLERWRDRIAARLEALRLHIHPAKCVIRRVGEGVPFLGYVVWPNRIRVRGETVRRFRRRMRRRRGKAEAPDRTRSVAAWRGHTQLAGAWRRLSVG